MTGRIHFANQLRGLAALSVAASHYIGVFWAMPDVVSSVTFSPPQQGEIPALFSLVGQPWFNPGPFGVAVFFLISGLVVPFSLEHHTRLSFIAARLLRIYPTYIAALLLEYLVLKLAAGLWHKPFHISAALLWSNAFLIYDWFGIASMDLVNWTLSVELKFYLLIALIAPLIRRGSAAALIAVAAAIFALNALMASGMIGNISAPPSSPTYTVSSHSLCLIYMLIGTAFNLHHRRLLPTAGLFITVTALAALFTATWQLSVWQAQYPIVTVNYAYALALFAGLYAIRHSIPPNRLLDAMANISFPFYVIHSLLGYSLLRALMVGLQCPYGPALAITLPTIALLAWILHLAVETPTAQAGRALASLRQRRLPQNQPELNLHKPHPSSNPNSITPTPWTQLRHGAQSTNGRSEQDG